MSDETNILASLGRVEANIANIQIDVARLAEVVVEGNGQLPLVTRVDRLEVADKQRRGSSKKTWATVLALIGAVGSGFAALAVTLASNGF